jgi:hypothetical protein
LLKLRQIVQFRNLGTLAAIFSSIHRSKLVMRECRNVKFLDDGAAFRFSSEVSMRRSLIGVSSWSLFGLLTVWIFSSPLMQAQEATPTSISNRGRAEQPQTLSSIGGDATISPRSAILGRKPATVEQVNNPLLDRYEQMRAQARDTQNDQVQLAQWCVSRNLKDQAKAHFVRALAFDPNNAAIRQALKHQQVNGTWLTEEQIQEMRQRAVQRHKDLKVWTPTVQKISRLISSSSPKIREKGRSQLAEIENAASIPALEDILIPQTE